MPYRFHRVRRPRLALTPALAIVLSIGPVPGTHDHLTDETLRAVWFEHRDAILARSSPGTRPWAFWAFEPGVPGGLRADRPQLRRVLDDPEAETRATVRQREAEADLERRRAAWLEREAAA